MARIAHRSARCHCLQLAGGWASVVEQRAVLVPPPGRVPFVVTVLCKSLCNCPACRGRCLWLHNRIVSAPCSATVCKSHCGALPDVSRNAPRSEERRPLVWPSPPCRVPRCWTSNVKSATSLDPLQCAHFVGEDDPAQCTSLCCSWVCQFSVIKIIGIPCKRLRTPGRSGPQ